jgi:hypothetical protein
MNHLTEDQLVLHYYGEADAPAGAASHLETCEICRPNYDSLRQTLDAISALVVPERGPDYGARVWERVRPQISKAPRRRVPPSWMKWGAIAAMVAAAFFLGRVSQRPQTMATAIPGQVKERILMVAVGDHLDRSQMVLAELVNTNPRGTLDISGEQLRVEDLVSENRLYRQAALRAGDASVSGVLEDLERVLLEIAHSPSRLDSAQLDELRQRIEAEGIMFKIRVVGSTVREREKVPLSQPAGKKF